MLHHPTTHQTLGSALRTERQRFPRLKTAAVRIKGSGVRVRLKFKNPRTKRRFNSPQVLRLKLPAAGLNQSPTIGVSKGGVDRYCGREAGRGGGLGGHDPRLTRHFDLGGLMQACTDVLIGRFDRSLRRAAHIYRGGAQHRRRRLCSKGSGAGNKVNQRGMEVAGLRARACLPVGPSRSRSSNRAHKGQSRGTEARTNARPPPLRGSRVGGRAWADQDRGRGSGIVDCLRPARPLAKLDQRAQGVARVVQSQRKFQGLGTMPARMVTATALGLRQGLPTPRYRAS